MRCHIFVLRASLIFSISVEGDYLNYYWLIFSIHVKGEPSQLRGQEGPRQQSSSEPNNFPQLTDAFKAFVNKIYLKKINITFIIKNC